MSEDFRNILATFLFSGILVVIHEIIKDSITVEKDMEDDE